MAELKIPYVIQEQRRKRNMTQEELAAALGVTAQSVSKWERGGYPDITMLPGIANYFEITVDELIGNDELSREIDIEHFYELIHGGGTREEKIQTAVEYVRKYPKDYRIAHEAAEFLMKLPEDKREPHLPLIRELCEKIIDFTCTRLTLLSDAEKRRKDTPIWKRQWNCSRSGVTSRNSPFSTPEIPGDAPPFSEI